MNFNSNQDKEFQVELRKNQLPSTIDEIVRFYLDLVKKKHKISSRLYVTTRTNGASMMMMMGEVRHRDPVLRVS